MIKFKLYLFYFNQKKFLIKRLSIPKNFIAKNVQLQNWVVPGGMESDVPPVMTQISLYIYVVSSGLICSSIYGNDHYWDRHALANSADPDQMPQN